MIEVRQLRYRYPGAQTDALCEIDLTVAEGQLLGLLGPNGAGKSTLISMLTGLRSPDSGSLKIDVTLSDISVQRFKQSIAWVPQDYAFYLTLSVIENLKFFGAMLGLTGVSLSEAITRSAKIAGLEDSLSKSARTLSGGLKRRLNIAISLLGNPACLILDEPTVGIDPQSRHFILDAVRRINEAGTTVIYSSHYMEEVQNLCDTIAIMDQGKILAIGSLNQLLTMADNRPLTRIQLGLPGLPLVRPELVGRSFALSEDRLLLSGTAVTSIDLAEQLLLLSKENIAINSVDSGSVSLEQLFLQLTDRSLRD